MSRLMWRVKLVTEFGAGETSEVEVARIERDEQAGLADLGLRIAEAKRLTAAIKAESSRPATAPIRWPVGRRVRVVLAVPAAVAPGVAEFRPPSSPA